MLIRVTAAHIKKGQRCDPCGCPVALAIRERLPDTGTLPPRLMVGIGLVYLDDTFDTSVPLPKSAIRFIDQFDDSAIPKRQLQPFAFRLKIPHV